MIEKRYARILNIGYDHIFSLITLSLLDVVIGVGSGHTGDSSI